jgi:hypothetical protein
LSVTAPGFSTEDFLQELPTGIPGLYWKPIAEFESFKFEGSVKGAFNEEKSDPWVDMFTGKLEGSTSIKAGARIGVGADKVASISLAATGQAGVSGAVEFGAHGRKLCLDEYKVNFGELNGAVTLRVKLIGWVNYEVKLVEHKFWEGLTLPPTKSPAQPIVIYTIPNPA